MLSAAELKSFLGKKMFCPKIGQKYSETITQFNHLDSRVSLVIRHHVIVRALVE